MFAKRCYEQSLIKSRDPYLQLVSWESLPDDIHYKPCKVLHACKLGKNSNRTACKWKLSFLLFCVTCTQAVEMSVITVLFKTLLNQTITPHVYKPLTLLGSSDLPCTFSWYTTRLWPFFLFTRFNLTLECMAVKSTTELDVIVVLRLCISALV